ncbi:glutathione S-transferase N-terminal domain-containing protein [Maricaulis salignorans]|uniref:Glutathione S-transferase n=1 Tax=Maricaulis salignorans TaxID=144026 RepID=A0A1G9UGK3_9PROT|nr:glutathione S-transferase N-terminal domain-containing protein [Maricaulis salignorans]SDM58685.1 glutathione S-transferase [Maricaulis salignorans]
MAQLIYSPTSPYARKCRILVRELGLEPAITETAANPFEDDDVLLRANPLGRVPCLVMEDGRALTESGLIAAWLNARAANPWRSDWDDRRLEALGHGLLDLAVARRVEMVREPGLFCDFWITRRERGILRALDELEAEMATLASPVSLGGLTIAVALDYLDFRYPESDWRQRHPGLESLHANWSGRASFAGTAPPVG